MKRNSTLRTGTMSALTALLFAAVLTGCNNSSDKSSTTDSTKMTTNDSAKMMTTPGPQMKDTMNNPQDTVHKGDQTPPPKM